MGYGLVPDNSKGKWWCKEPCQHRDCAANRKDWEIDNKCKTCGEPLKPGDKFYYVEQGKTAKVHMICEIERVGTPSV